MKSENTTLSNPTTPASLHRSVLDKQLSEREVSIVATARCEIRAVICFLNAKGVSPIDIHRQLTEVYGDKCIAVQHVRKWCRKFTGCCTEIHDEERSGRPSVSDEIVEKIKSRLLSKSWLPSFGRGKKYCCLTLYLLGQQ